jgi:hypothetical protein
MAVVKSNIEVDQKNLSGVSKSELILEMGLRDVMEFIKERNGEINQKYMCTLILVSLNDHAVQIQRAL